MRGEMGFSLDIEENVIVVQSYSVINLQTLKETYSFVYAVSLLCRRIQGYSL
jgi:hypothetical protein